MGLMFLQLVSALAKLGSTSSIQCMNWKMEMEEEKRRMHPPFLSHNKDEVETEKEMETRQLLHVDGKHASLHALFPVWGTPWRISFSFMYL